MTLGNRFGDDMKAKVHAVVQNSMLARPGRTLERAMSHLHVPVPDPDTANALSLMYKAWVAIQKEAGRAI